MDYLNKNEAKVFYREDGINRKLDDGLREVFKKHGYGFWASGIKTETTLRDLAFSKQERKT